MKNLLLFSLVVCTTMAMAQNNPINFEPGGFGADWTWATFEAPAGQVNPEFSVVPNVLVNDVNPSANVARMVISYPSDAPWGQAGCESQQGTDLGTFSFTDQNSTVTLLFYQEGFASNVALKFSTATGAAFFEKIFPNNLANQWVEATFDMSEWIGNPLGGQPGQIIFFPSYGPRATGHTVYFDNVVFGPPAPAAGDPEAPAPDPTVDEALVLSVYSGAYTNNVVANFNFNAFQGAGTISEVQIQGNNTGKIEGLTFYGAQWTAANVSEFDTVHLDYYATTSTAFNFYLIDQAAGIPGGAPQEPRYAFGPGGDAPLQTGEWVGVDIPLQHFLDFNTGNFTFNLNNIFQWKFDGNGNLFFDNIYFYKEGPSSVGNMSISSRLMALPNPSNNAWSVRSDQGAIQQLRLYNQLGQLVWSSAVVADQIAIPATTLKRGVYTARVATDQGVGVIKLMKE